MLLLAILLAALGLLGYAAVSLWRDRPRPLVLASQVFDDNEPTTVARRHRSYLVTLQEAKTVVRQVIAYRPTRR